MAQPTDIQTITRLGSLELRARKVVQGLLAGTRRSPMIGNSVEFAQHRAYAQGDDLRRLDWKLMARTDKPYLKQYDVEINQQVMLVVDGSESMQYGSSGDALTKFEYASVCATALAYLACRQQDAVGLNIASTQLDKVVKSSTSPSQWRVVAAALQGASGAQRTSLRPVLLDVAQRLTGRSLVIVLSDFFDDLEAIRAGLTALRARRHEVMCLTVMDAAELTFPFQRVTQFVGLEAMGELVGEPRGLRDAYLEQVRKFLGELSAVCKALDVEQWLFDSSVSPEVSLTHALQRRPNRDPAMEPA